MGAYISIIPNEPIFFYSASKNNHNYIVLGLIKYFYVHYLIFFLKEQAFIKSVQRAYLLRSEHLLTLCRELISTISLNPHKGSVE